MAWNEKIERMTAGGLLVSLVWTRNLVRESTVDRPQMHCCIKVDWFHANFYIAFREKHQASGSSILFH